MAKHICIQGASLYIQSTEGIEKIKYRDLSETSVIKSEIQSTMDMVKKIDQDHKSPTEYLKK